MSGEANCIICSEARAVVAVFPIARGYALKVYECPCCGSTLHLVTRMTEAALIKQHCESLLPVEKLQSSTGRKAQPRFAT